jgi:hypothetical protein
MKAMKAFMRSAALVLLVVAGLAGCGGDGSSPAGAGSDGGADQGSAGKGGLGAACATDADCDTGLSCPAGIYDRGGPRCTYHCDPANPNPKCPTGCNMKGYCRLN